MEKAGWKMTKGHFWPAAKRELRLLVLLALRNHTSELIEGDSPLIEPSDETAAPISTLLAAYDKT